MDRIAVFVDDAEHASQMLAPMLAAGAPPTHWVVVACAPRLTHRIGKWVSNSNREQWRDHWMRTLRQRLEPTFRNADPATCEWMLAKGPLDRLSNKLRARLGAELRLLDARRPKLGVELPPLLQGEAPQHRWTTPVAVSSSLAVVLALTD